MLCFSRVLSLALVVSSTSIRCTSAERGSQPHENWYAPESSNSLFPEDACPGKVVPCGAAGIEICKYNKGKGDYKTLCVNPNGVANMLKRDEESYCGPCREGISDSKTYYSSPFDGRLFSFEVDGFKATFSGPYGKSLDIPLSLEVVSSDGNTTTFTMDDSGDLTKMEVVDFNDEYSSFEFDSRPDGLLVKLFLQAYGYRASFLFPPFSQDASTGDNDVRLLWEEGDKNVPPEAQKRALAGASSVRAMKTGLRHLASDSTPAEAWILLTECFQNVDPTELRVTASSDGNTFPLSTEKASEGFYKAKFSVAESEISEDIVGYACEGIEVAGEACPFIIKLGAAGSASICTSVLSAIAATGVGAGVAVPVFNACLAGFTGGAAVCAVYDKYGLETPPGAEGLNLIDEACVATSDLLGFIEDLFFPEIVTVTAEARLPSGDFVSGSVTWKPETEGFIAPPIELEGPGIPEVTAFYPVPDAPVAFQSYTAFAFIICATDQTTATISIQGTDGYTDFVTCSGSSIRSTGGCSLNVPGAEDGVVDTLSLTVNDPLIAPVFQVTGLFFR